MKTRQETNFVGKLLVVFVIFMMLAIMVRLYSTMGEKI